jgi:TolB-like protein/DNA-binding winged helix-turn-helix (wHTH) protein
MSPELSQYDTIRFGEFELRLQSGELLRDGSAIKLAPQPFKVLLLLAENPSRLVTRKEIQEKIWGTETFVDFDKGMNLCIAQIREALGDDAQAPRFIETLPRRGYRFVARIEKHSTGHELPPRHIGEIEPTPASPSAQEHNLQTRPSSVKRNSKVAFALGLTILFALAIPIVYLRVAKHRGGSSNSYSKAMLVVLPFENLTNDPAQDYFSDGLTEEMITTLGSLEPKRLGVIARTTALTYKKSGKDIRQIGRELGVNYVLEGSVRREGGRLRITSQLIQVDDQTHLWADTFDRNETDVLGIQRDVASRVAEDRFFMYGFSVFCKEVFLS